MNMMLFIGTSAVTHGLKDACRAQARDFANLGMTPLAVATEIMTEVVFAPVVFWQDQMARAIQSGIATGN